MSTPHIDPWIQTYQGIAFDLVNPSPDQIDLLDIAQALSLLNRFAGHTRVPYMVAEHSIYMSEVPGLLPVERLAALMHDAHEAYVNDISAPLGQLLLVNLPDGQITWSAYKKRVQAAICKRLTEPYGVTLEDCHSRVIKYLDLAMLAAEKERFLGPEPKPWMALPPPLEVKWRNIGSPYEIANEFVRRYRELTGLLAN